MLISAKKRLLAFALLFLGTVLAIMSLFVFSAGWERSNAVLLVFGTAATVSSLFIFTIGWDQLKSYRNTGQISGRLEFPALGYSLTFHPTVSVSNIDGSNRTLIPNTSGKGFRLKGVMPGEYRVSVEGYGLVTVTRPITVLPRRCADVGTVHLDFDPEQFWHKETVAPFRMGHRLYVNHIGPGPDGNVWAAGFSVNERYSDTYKLFRRQETPPVWREVVVPQFNKQASRINVMKLFSDGTFLVGSLGGGAVVSDDGGRSWRALEISGIDSVSHVIELPSGTWLVAGFRRWIERPNPSLLIARSSDSGIHKY